MKHTFLFKFLFFSFLSFSISIQAQIKKEYFDGPYIFHEGDNIRIQWVERGIGHDSIIPKSEATVFKRESLPEVNLQDLGFYVPSAVSYSNVPKFVAVSDLHGQYDIFVKLLRAQGVVDQNNKWIYDKGHLIIVGDNFDRGDKVLDILWLLFDLQKQADKAGGLVQVLLGNHEMMVLNGDLRYLNKKYYYSGGVLKNIYPKLFRKGSVLGDWIASHHVLTSVNNKLFVHGGVSPKLLKLDLPLKKINQLFSEKMIRKTDNEIQSDTLLAELNAGNGPLWYRGYFDSTTFNMKTIDKILRKTKQETIIVGHTSFKEIKSLYDGKIIAVDCSIKLGKTGQMLVYENESMYVGNIDGTKREITHHQNEKTSLFDAIYNMEGQPKIRISTDAKRLIRKSLKEEYQEGHFELATATGEKILDLKGKVRARGNMRKQVCYFPPIKFDFSKTDLDSVGYLDIDKLKFVFPCKSGKTKQELLYKEYFLYELYNLIDPHSIRAKLVDIVFFDGKNEKHNMTGIMIEDEESYAQRKNAKVIEKGKLRASGLQRPHFQKVQFFQYMIANSDWSVGNKHNLEMVKIPEFDRVIALPYDFDYSGFVGQDYAVPSPSLPIEDVHQRYFFSYKVTEKEFYAMVDYYKSIEEEVYKLCDQATYMKKGTRKDNKKYLKSFFDLLKNPKRLKSNTIDR